MLQRQIAEMSTFQYFATQHCTGEQLHILLLSFLMQLHAELYRENVAPTVTATYQSIARQVSQGAGTQ